MPGKPSQIHKQADSLGIWHKVSIAMRRPRSGRGAYFGIGPRRDLCTSLPRKRSCALWPSATTRGLRATWSGWKARKNERTTTRSLRRNSQVLGDEPPIAPMRAFWLLGRALPFCAIPLPCGSALWAPDLTGRKSWRYSPECVEGEFCEVRIDGVLRSSSPNLVTGHTYIPLRHTIYCPTVTVGKPKAGEGVHR